MNNPNNNTNSSINANKHNTTNSRNVTANISSSRRGSSAMTGIDNNHNGNGNTASTTSDSLYATAAAAMGLPSHPHHVTFGTSTAGNIGAAAAAAAVLGPQTNNNNNATNNSSNNHNPATASYWDHLMSMDSSALYATMEINAVVADVLGGGGGSSAGGNGSAVPVDPLNFAGLTSLSSNSGNNNAATAAATSTAQGLPSQQPLAVPPSSFFNAFQQQQQPAKVSAGAAAAAANNAIMLSQQQRQQMQHLLTQPQSHVPPPPYNNNSGAGTSGGGVTVSSKPFIASNPASMLMNAASVVASSNIPKSTGSAPDLTSSSTGPSTLAANASAKEKAAFHRERNRQHARSTRARKKAYVNKLKELVEHLHMERTEEARKRRVAASTQAETSRVRKSVVLKFLELHSCNIPNTTTASTNIIAANPATITSSNTNVRRIPTLNDFTSICEEHCTLKQPITPFRWFNRCEISGEHRLSRGVSSIYADCCSMNVMIANIGCRSPRWGTLRQYDFFGGNVNQLHHSSSNNTGRGTGDGSGSTIGSGSRSNGGLSSLSSASNIGNNGNCNTKSPQDHTSNAATATNTNANPTASNAAGSGGGAAVNSKLQQQQLVEAGLHDYHAQPLPDPLLSGDDCSDDSNNPNATSTIGTSTSASITSISNSKKRKLTSLPSQQHQQQPSRNQPPRKFAPAIALPPFVGVGKRAGEHNLNNPNSSNKKPKPNTNQVSSTLAVYNLNQDDMLLTNDTLMSPYTFRTVNAIQQGALSEVFQMGMLRVTFSSYNRLTSIEMIYDAMGFMQQLERANGASIPLPSIRDRSGRLTQEEDAEEEEEDVGSLVVPNGLEMALQPCGSCEARVITLASPPYTIVSVNEGFVRLTKFTQLDAEGKTLDDLLGVSGSSLPLHQQQQFLGSDGSTSCILDRNSSSRGSSAGLGTTTAAGSTGEDTISSNNHLNLNLNSKLMVSTAGASSTPLAGKTITRGSTNATAATAAAGKSSNTARSHLSQGMIAKTLTPHLPTHRTLLHANKRQRDDDHHHEEEVEEDGTIKGVRQQFANFISSYPLTNVNNQVTHILHVCRELRSRWPDAPFGIGTDAAGGSAGRHHHSLSDMRVVGVRGGNIASSDDFSG